MQRGWGIARLPHPQPNALSSAQTTQAGRAGPRGAPPRPGWHRSCRRHARCSPLRNARRWLSHGRPGPPSSPGHSGGCFPAWPCHHGCWVVAACRGGGASASGWAEPRTEGWFAGVGAAQKQGLAGLSLRLELRFPSAVLGVEPCGNSPVKTGKRSSRSRCVCSLPGRPSSDAGSRQAPPGKGPPSTCPIRPRSRPARSPCESLTSRSLSNNREKPLPPGTGTGLGSAQADPCAPWRCLDPVTLPAWSRGGRTRGGGAPRVV